MRRQTPEELASAGPGPLPPLLGRLALDVELFSRIAATAASPSHAFYEYPLPEWTEIPGSKVTGRAIRRAGFAMLRLIAERRIGLPARSVAADLPRLTVVHAATATVGKAA